MPQGGANSFVKFTLGFTVFIALSFGLTYAVSTYSIAQEKERQVGAAYRAMTGEEESWWDRVF